MSMQMNYNETELKNELIKYGKMIWERGYSPGYSGNISARINDEEKFIITTSGSSNGFLSENELVLTDFSGNSIEENKKPSSEKNLHIAFYKKRPDISFILHVHSPYLSSFASAKKQLQRSVMAENIFYLNSIPLAKYAMPSSFDLVKNTEIYFDKYDVVLMANHGVIVGSNTLQDAFLKLELAESYAQVVINTEILGGPKRLNDKQVNDILNLRNK